MVKFVYAARTFVYHVISACENDVTSDHLYV